MRNLALAGTTAVVLILSAGAAFAMAGGGDLSPDQSPYAILEPQTLGTPVAPEVTEGRSSAETIDRPVEEHHHHGARRVRKFH